MKFFSVVALSLFGLAAAQAQCEALTNQFQPCAKKCIDTHGSQHGCAGGPKDLKCLCSKISEIQTGAADCVKKECPGADTAALQTQARAVCSCVNGAKKARMI